MTNTKHKLTLPLGDNKQSKITTSTKTTPPNTQNNQAVLFILAGVNDFIHCSYHHIWRRYYHTYCRSVYIVVGDDIYITSRNILSSVGAYSADYDMCLPIAEG